MFKMKILEEVKGIRLIQVNNTYQLHDIESDFTFACLDSKEEAIKLLEKETSVNIKENNKLKNYLKKLELELKEEEVKLNNSNEEIYMYNCLDIQEEILNIRSQIF